VHSHQNSIARTFSAEVLKYTLEETWMKATLKYNAVMSGKKFYIWLTFRAAAKDNARAWESWAQIHGNRKCCGMCTRMADMPHCIVFRPGKHLPTCCHQIGENNTQIGSRNHCQLQVDDRSPVWF